MRIASPVYLAPLDLWMVLDFAGVQQVLLDHCNFSSDLSHVPGRGNPGDWFIFFDPPRHTKLRPLIAKAFTPRVAHGMEQRIWNLAGSLLDDLNTADEIDLVEGFSGPLPMRVIAELLGIPVSDWPRYKRWSDSILRIANTFAPGEETDRIFREFREAAEEIRDALPELIAQARSLRDDALLPRLRSTVSD